MSVPRGTMTSTLNTSLLLKVFVPERVALHVFFGAVVVPLEWNSLAPMEVVAMSSKFAELKPVEGSLRPWKHDP